jgi:tight adherence protein B
LSGEAVASAFIIGSLPPGIGTVVAIMQPTYIAPLLYTPRGHVIIAIAVGIEAFGAFVMRRMINFKF